ncbi:outer membrane beta-barrel protein [Alkalitalea saponilacus]|uniref:Outer membrane protein beta-barrel domain-containing protein n=1 Tax=Alkalitalea saponilacus TaxID=889453 RepID=A0A1T5FNT0_9BACT|nr:outer membrane beta-barrel protein [Alkalitalea saponilacus]SKB97818.1 Outer membrane protein beta-barrel domain-containing protein [Alkalitalea saponilacus]
MRKKILFVLALVVIGTATSFGQWRFGGGLSLGTEADGGDLGFGLSPRADYTINENFRVASNFTYWFTDSDYTSWAFNGDVHYTFAGDEAMNFYGLAGLNYSKVSWNFEFMGIKESYSNSEIGLNLGAGANMGMFFGEIKYETTWSGQLVLSVGVLF